MTEPVPFEQAPVVHRVVRRAAATRAGAWLTSRVAHQVDHAVLRRTGGRHSLTSLLTGLHVVVLTTTGARSGLSRSVPLLGVPTADGIAVIASSYGSTRHPAWFHNLRAEPRATATVRGVRLRVTAEVLDGEHRELVWRRGLEMYPGWAAYDARSGDRTIPVVLLRVVEEGGRT